MKATAPALDLDPDRRLALAYVPAAIRPAVEALWRLDVTFASVLVTGREPMVSRIRLAWWREALEALDAAPAPAEPLLRSIAAYLLPAGLTGAALAAMEEGWAALLSDAPLDAAALDAHARLRGGALFALTARLLGAGDGESADAGALWALVDLARHSRDPAEQRSALDEAARFDPPRAVPARLRPLTMLAVLAARDRARGPSGWERAGAPARMLRMLRHRTGGN